MSGEVITTISPTTDEPILTRNGISPEEIKKLPEIATQAFATWRKTTLQERKDIIKKALAILDQKKDELANELTVQMGRPIAYTPKEIGTAIKRAEFLLKVSDEVLQDTPGEPEAGFKRFIRKVPVGPVLIIFAWNVRRGTRRSRLCRLVLTYTVPVPNPRQCIDTRSPLWQLGHLEAFASDTHHRRAGRKSSRRSRPSRWCTPVLPLWIPLHH